MADCGSAEADAAGHKAISVARDRLVIGSAGQGWGIQRRITVVPVVTEHAEPLTVASDRQAAAGCPEPKPATPRARRCCAGATAPPVGRGAGTVARAKRRSPAGRLDPPLGHHYSPPGNMAPALQRGS